MDEVIIVFVPFNISRTNEVREEEASDCVTDNSVRYVKFFREVEIFLVRKRVDVDEGFLTDELADDVVFNFVAVLLMLEVIAERLICSFLDFVVMCSTYVDVIILVDLVFNRILLIVLGTVDFILEKVDNVIVLDFGEVDEVPASVLVITLVLCMVIVSENSEANELVFSFDVFNCRYVKLEENFIVPQVEFNGDDSTNVDAEKLFEDSFVSPLVEVD